MKIRSQTKLFSQLFSFYINYKIIIVQVRYITIETKEVVRIGYNGFLYPQEYPGIFRGARNDRTSTGDILIQVTT